MQLDIRGTFASKGFQISSEQEAQFIKYLELLQSWNEKLNLVADSSESEIISRHFLDSLEVTKYADFDSTTKVIDVGTGAGFPGLPLAIFTESHFTLVDSLNKRLVFLEHVIKELCLTNVVCVHSRFEDLAHNQIYREKFDYAVSRAVAPLNVLLEFTLPFLSNNGFLLAHKGSLLSDELLNAGKALSILKGNVVNVYDYIDDKEIQRYIVKVQKMSSISNKFPRRPGTPKSTPII